jgi:hypothetical protein
MLTLTAERGDVAIRTDVNQTFILSAEPAATLANWKQLLFPMPVTSFNTRTGAVTLLLADVTAALGFTPVNKAGDTMTGALNITNSLNGLNVLDLLTQSAGQGIRLTAQSTVMLLEMLVSGAPALAFKVDAGSTTPMVIIKKDLNDEFIAKILGGSGGRNWGLLIDISASGIYGESFLRLKQSGVTVFDFLANGLVALGVSVADLSGTGKVHMGGDSFRLNESRSPASNATGKAGEHCWDANYIYICTATDTWKRAALTGGY